MVTHLSFPQQKEVIIITTYYYRDLIFGFRLHSKNWFNHIPRHGCLLFCWGGNWERLSDLSWSKGFYPRTMWSKRKKKNIYMYISASFMTTSWEQGHKVFPFIALISIPSPHSSQCHMPPWIPSPHIQEIPVFCLSVIIAERGTCTCCYWCISIGHPQTNTIVPEEDGRPLSQFHFPADISSSICCCWLSGLLPLLWVGNYQRVPISKFWGLAINMFLNTCVWCIFVVWVCLCMHICECLIPLWAHIWWLSLT